MQILESFSTQSLADLFFCSLSPGCGLKNRGSQSGVVTTLGQNQNLISSYSSLTAQIGTSGGRERKWARAGASGDSRVEATVRRSHQYPSVEATIRGRAQVLQGGSLWADHGSVACDCQTIYIMWPITIDILLFISSIGSCKVKCLVVMNNKWIRHFPQSYRIWVKLKQCFTILFLPIG